MSLNFRPEGSIPTYLGRKERGRDEPTCVQHLCPAHLELLRRLEPYTLTAGWTWGVWGRCFWMEVPCQWDGQTMRLPWSGTRFPTLESRAWYSDGHLVLGVSGDRVPDHRSQAAGHPIGTGPRRFWDCLSYYLQIELVISGTSSHDQPRGSQVNWGSCMIILSRDTDNVRVIVLVLFVNSMYMVNT